jgi:hypothetical protein
MVATFLSCRIVVINGCDELTGEEDVETAVLDCRSEGDAVSTETALLSRRRKTPVAIFACQLVRNPAAIAAI